MKTELPRFSAASRACRYREGSGFTLIELMVIIAIVGIIAVIAAPSFQTFILNNRLRAQTNEFASSLALARIEAVKRAVRVVVCPGTVAGCTGTSWEIGWITFVDGNNNASYSGNQNDMLEIHQPLEGNNTLRTTADATLNQYVSFLYDGRAENIGGFSQQGTFVLCDSVRGFGSNARAVLVAATGRVRTDVANAPGTDVASCTPP